MKFKEVEKIVINAGVGKKRQASHFDDKILPEIINELKIITGQKPALKGAKKSVAGFNVRKGDTVGLVTVLRGARMYNFLIRLISVVLPRVKDFKGLELKAVDQGGNLNMGFIDQFPFPEINPEKSKITFSFEVTIVLKNKDRKKAIDFYRKIGVPLKITNN